MTDRRKFWNDILRQHAAMMEIALPKLEPCDVSIRPLRADAWPPCGSCGRDVNHCRCGDER